MPFICSRCARRFDQPLERCPHDGRRVVRDLSGQTVGSRYTLRELVGVGGMGSSVWSAWQASTQREVAVKLLPPTTESATERFTRGARIASNLNHPNITVVHDYGRTVMGDLYLVMELMDGMNLFRASRKERLTVPRIVHMMDQVLRALGHAHRRSVVHRDIKLSNLFLTPTEDDPDFVKVLDFGIARQFRSRGTEDPNTDAVEVTAANQLCGTPQYMAPEQIGFDDVDGRTDLYAVGIATFHLLTGRFPFQGSPHELFRQHLQAPPPDVSEHSDLEIPPGLSEWIEQAMQKSPDARFPSADAMRRALAEIDLRPTIPRGIIPSAPRSDIEIEPPSSGIVTPPPSGTAGELGIAPESGTGSSRWGMMTAVVLATLATAAVLIWPDAGSDQQEGNVVARAQPAVVTPERGVDSKEVPRAQPNTVAVVKPTPVPKLHTKREILIKTYPAGVQVRLKGKVLGKTPLKHTFPFGAHRLVLSRKGYGSLDETIVVGKGSDGDQSGVRSFKLTKSRKKKNVRKRRGRKRKSVSRRSKPRAVRSQRRPSVSKPPVASPSRPPARPPTNLRGRPPKADRAPQIEALE